MFQQASWISATCVSLYVWFLTSSVETFNFGKSATCNYFFLQLFPSFLAEDSCQLFGPGQSLKFNCTDENFALILNYDTDDCSGDAVNSTLIMNSSDSNLFSCCVECEDICESYEMTLDSYSGNNCSGSTLNSTTMLTVLDIPLCAPLPFVSGFGNSIVNAVGSGINSAFGLNSSVLNISAVNVTASTTVSVSETEGYMALLYNTTECSDNSSIGSIVYNIGCNIEENDTSTDLIVISNMDDTTDTMDESGETDMDSSYTSCNYYFPDGLALWSWWAEGACQSYSPGYSAIFECTDENDALITEYDTNDCSGNPVSSTLYNNSNHDVNFYCCVECDDICESTNITLDYYNNNDCSGVTNGTTMFTVLNRPGVCAPLPVYSNFVSEFGSFLVEVVLDVFLRAFGIKYNVSIDITASLSTTVDISETQGYVASLYNGSNCPGDAVSAIMFNIGCNDLDSGDDASLYVTVGNATTATDASDGTDGGEGSNSEDDSGESDESGESGEDDETSGGSEESGEETDTSGESEDSGTSGGSGNDADTAYSVYGLYCKIIYFVIVIGGSIMLF